PAWSDADQQLARALQEEIGARPSGLATRVAPIERGIRDEDNRGGGSDDIGDVSWVVPTVVLRYPANIPDLPGHNWANAVAMATPIAHKGTTAGAQALAMLLVDVLTTPALVEEAWRYFREVQTKDVQYAPLIGPDDPPAIHMNRETMSRHREAMRPHYYDPSKYRTYLEQLGIAYPTVRAR